MAEVRWLHIRPPPGASGLRRHERGRNGRSATSRREKGSPD